MKHALKFDFVRKIYGKQDVQKFVPFCILRYLNLAKPGLIGYC